MDPFLVYKLYLGLRLHFTTPKYDIVKMRGHVRATQESYAKRHDLVGIRRLARKYRSEEVIEFLVANFVSGDRWGGMFDMSAETRYKDWQKRMESLSYLYREDLTKLCELAGDSFDSLYDCRNGHPPILKAYMNKEVSLETLVILNRCLPYTDRLYKYLANDIIWPDVALLIAKYTPFVRINKAKYTALTDKILTTHF